MTDSPSERSGAARVVAQALPAWGQLRVVRGLSGGHRASVFLVERDGNGEVARDAVGDRFVAKTTSRSGEAVAWAAALARRAREAGLGASGYLATVDGRWMVAGVTLQPFLEGRPATAAERRAASARLRSFHAATAPCVSGQGSPAARRSFGGGAGVTWTWTPCRKAWCACAGMLGGLFKVGRERRSTVI